MIGEAEILLRGSRRRNKHGDVLHGLLCKGFKTYMVCSVASALPFHSGFLDLTVQISFSSHFGICLLTE